MKNTNWSKAIKTGLTLSGPIVMMGNNLAFSVTSLLNTAKIDNVHFKHFTSALSYISMTYILIFTRGVSLWNYFSKEKKSSPLIKNLLANRIDLCIASIGLISTLSYFFFNGYLAASSLTKMMNQDQWMLTISIWIYVCLSLTFSYLNFALPKAITNGKDIVKIISGENRQMQYMTLVRSVACTSLGTLSFGALAHFLIKNAENVMPIAKDFSSVEKNIISGTIAGSSMLLFALAKSLESYQYFAKQHHFQQNSTENNSGCNLITYSHHTMGLCYLSLIFAGYYQANLDLLQNLGADITFCPKNIGYFILAALSTSSSTFIEYVFSYKNMLAETQRFFVRPRALADLEIKDTQPENSNYQTFSRQ